MRLKSENTLQGRAGTISAGSTKKTAGDAENKTASAEVIPDRRPVVPVFASVDWVFLGIVVLLCGTGLVMLFSASVAQAERVLADPAYYVRNQAIYMLIALAVAMVVWRIPLSRWERAGPWLLAFGLLLLVVVLIPGIGKSVNGSRRWLDLGLSFQPSEAFKLFLIVYLAGYLVRKGGLLRKALAIFIVPLAVAAAGAALLLLEPDFGAAFVVMLTAVVMLFVAGARWLHLMAIASLLVPIGAILIWLAPYRLSRLMSFLDPWSDPYASGFQLTQALIAIGRGGWTGVGLGSSVQKMAYLPEAHTDFVFAVTAEETGFLGVVVVISLFAGLVWRCFSIARRAERLAQPFAAFVATGIGFWLGLQAAINIGANMGVLPTKGITLPLFSYGGSSMLIVGIACALMMRIYREGSEQQTAESRRDVNARLYTAGSLHHA